MKKVTAVLLFSIACQRDQTPPATAPRLEVELPPEAPITGQPHFLEVRGGGWQYPHTSLLPTGPGSDDRGFVEAVALFRANKVQEAIPLLQQFTQQNPRHAGGWSVLSACLFRNRQMKEGADAARRAAQLEPSPNAWNNLATILMVGGDTDGAIYAFEQALLLDSKNYLAWRNLASLHYARHNLTEASWALWNLVRIDPLDTYGYISLGQTYVEQGKLGDALELYQARISAINTMPEERQRKAGLTIELPLAMGKVLFMQGDLEGAEKNLLWALEVAAGVPSSWVPVSLYRGHIYANLGRLYEAQSKIPKAIQSYQAALEQQKEKGFDLSLARVYDPREIEARIAELKHHTNVGGTP